MAILDGYCSVCLAPTLARTGTPHAAADRSTCRWEGILSDTVPLEEEQAILDRVGPPTILNAELASDDESGDDDFKASDSESEGRAGPSGMRQLC
jgi:hypothetical protein